MLAVELDKWGIEPKDLRLGLDMLGKAGRFEIVRAYVGEVSTEVDLRYTLAIERNNLRIEYNRELGELEFEYSVESDYVPYEAMRADAEKACGGSEDCVEEYMRRARELVYTELSCAPKSLKVTPAIGATLGCRVFTEENGIVQQRYVKFNGKVVSRALIWLIPALWYMGLYLLDTYSVW